MNNKSRLVLKALLQHFHRGQEANLCRYLPSVEAQAMDKLELGETSLADILQPSRIALQHMHYSWMEPAFLQLPKPLQLPCLASLPPNHAKRLSALLKKKVPVTPPCRAIQDYLLDLLYKEIINPKVRPRTLLIPNDFDYLLGMEKRKIIDVIDYLGIHDLAITMRHVVDKPTVQLIMQSLQPPKQKYLKLCLRSKNPLKTPDINLQSWDRSPEQLKAKLQKRGIARLGKALSGQDPSFLWHLARSLDIGRGKTLMRHLASKPVPGVTPFLAGQVSNIVRYMEK